MDNNRNNTKNNFEKNGKMISVGIFLFYEKPHHIADTGTC